MGGPFGFTIFRKVTEGQVCYPPNPFPPHPPPLRRFARFRKHFAGFGSFENENKPCAICGSIGRSPAHRFGFSAKIIVIREVCSLGGGTGKGGKISMDEVHWTGVFGGPWAFGLYSGYS